jgi:chromosome segregation ATPase
LANSQSAAEEHREKVKNIIEERKATLAEIREDWKEKRTEFLDNLKAEKERLRNEFKEKFTEERCARVQARIENRNGFFQGNYEKHTSVYVNLVNRINKFITRADEAKLDTATIKSHLAVLEDKIEKFKDDYAAYKAKFEEIKNYTCGHSEGEFKAALLDSKTLLKQVHADAADIRTYVRETILADMRALKAQMPDAETEDEDDADEDAETNN